jgi:hypothetical protein
MENIHQIITFEGRDYQYDPNCACTGCKSLRQYPTPSKCDWCKQIHCGGSEHCSPKEHGGGGEVFGADQTNNTLPEGYLESLCGDISDRITAITNHVKENYGMAIPKYEPSPATTTTTTSSKSGKSKQSGHKYLSVNDLTHSPKDAKILACMVEVQHNFSKTESVVIVKLSLDGQIRLWTLRVNNPNLDTLTHAFGSEENDWVEKKIQLRISEPTFKGQTWPEALVPDSELASKKKR